MSYTAADRHELRRTYLPGSSADQAQNAMATADGEDPARAVARLSGAVNVYSRSPAAIDVEGLELAAAAKFDCQGFCLIHFEKLCGRVAWLFTAA